MSSNSLKWWLNYEPLTPYEQRLLSRTRPDEYKLVTNVSDDLYFDLMPNCNISSNEYELRFDKCATNHIEYLFNNHVSEDTLVISSSDEHSSVKKCLKRCKNKYIFNYNEEVMNIDLSNLKKIIHGYKKVFVYIIGTQISTGQITPQLFFEELINLLVENSIDYIITLDDVHGMFLFPRDYRLFDYVIYTAHALIEDFDMGLLVKKKEISCYTGISMCDWANEYLEMLKVILKRKEKLFMFRTVMEDNFSNLLKNDSFETLTRTSPHIFSILIKNLYFSDSVCKILKSYGIRIENSGKKTFARFRAQSYIKDPTLIVDGINKFMSIIDITS